MEIFSDKDCQFSNGSIQVVTELPFYAPGDIVNGTVYLSVTHALTEVQGLQVEVKGGSKNSFKRFWHEHEGEGED